MFDPIIRFVLMTTLGIKDSVDKARDEKGATAVEYGLLVALIAGVIIVVVTTLGTQVQAAFQNISDNMP